MENPNTPVAPAAEAPASPEPSTPTATKPAATPTAAEVKKWKLKLEGKEEELTEEEVIKYAQLGKTSDKRFKEAARIDRQAKEFINALKTKEGARAILSNPSIGIDLKEFAIEIINEQIEQDSMTPEQKKSREMERKLKDYEERERSEKERHHKQQMASMEAEQIQLYDKMFADALNQSGLPKTPYTIKRMAELQLLNMKSKTNLTAGQLAKLVKEDYEAEQKQFFTSANETDLLAILGEDVVKRLNSAQLKKIQTTLVTTPGKKATTPAKEAPKNTSDAWKAFTKKNRQLY